jgi:outer membrane protein TolC
MRLLKVTVATALALAVIPASMQAQQSLTLDECRQMAIQNNKDLDQARTQVEMAGYDKKTALAYYFPNITATGTYQYNEKNISLISDDMSTNLQNVGTAAQTKLTTTMTQLMQAIMSNPLAVAEYQSSPMWQTVVGAMQKTDVSSSLNALGAEIDDAFHLDIHNVFVGAVSAQQPVFMGGKIIASNQVAKLAEDLAKSQYDMQYQQIVVDVDQAYWQIVSIANKKKLAETYCDLLHKLQNDAEIAKKEGVYTESDVLSIKVKANEADMLKTKATNGLVLAKMFLCKEIGLDLATQITLADENLEEIPVPQMGPQKDMDQVYTDRPETRSLNLASEIYTKKVTIAQADMLPKIAVTANYLMSNPNAYNGFQNKWGGMFNAGVVVNIPIFHGFEALNKTRKAKAEATLYQSKYDNAKNMINLQVSQLRQQETEALEKLNMANSNVKSAEENLRTANVGYEAGVITTNTALAAHTAWLQAHSECIDAGIELQMVNANLQKAEGNYKSDMDTENQKKK